ncbi:MAG: gluconate 2-dehydrogenase gamma chain [Acetobacteraceae bacterium]|nr:gluconate 2-dehydrogenase gamma chain [Acetobacteraceae bacterium]
MSGPKRRELLASTSVALLSSAAMLPASSPALGAVVKGELPWMPGVANPPAAVEPGSWQYFKPEEGTAVEAIVDRLIPPDPETPGGKDSGCAVFIDRQLASPYGRFDDRYMKGPFHPGTKEQGDQSPLTPAQHYRLGLAALDKYSRSSSGGTAFAQLPDERKDAVLKGLEDGSVKLDEVDGQQFFTLVLTDTKHGFFADLVYGGNKGMVAWRMIGFPGARYDYRDWVHRHNERYPLPPVSIREHPNWKP